MRRTPEVESQIGLLFGIPWRARLCDDCEQDINISGTGTSPSNLSFAGPFLVRHEDNYDVVRLRSCDLLVVEPEHGAYRWETILAKVEEKIGKAAGDGTIPQPDPRKRFTGMLIYRDVFYPTDRGPGTDRYRAILGEATQDPCPAIRRHARGFLEQYPRKDTADGDPSDEITPPMRRTPE